MKFTIENIINYTCSIYVLEKENVSLVRFEDDIPTFCDRWIAVCRNTNRIITIASTRSKIYKNLKVSG